jgi:alkanesulfonate monooxygenase SsuD/methylene tetrahydromethanopterin reductase-like flavin-dependent oxidoreductase (luciferase family)
LIPIYTGGSSNAAFRRAAKYANGWIGHGNTLDEVPRLMAKLYELRSVYGREKEPFETIIPLTSPPDLDDFKRLEDMGVSASVSYPFLFTLGPNSSVDEKRRHLEDFSKRFIQPLA